MSDSPGDKPHKPTKKRLRDARKRGEVPRSAEVSSAVVFAAAALLTIFLASNVVSRIVEFWMVRLRVPSSSTVPFDATNMLHQTLQLWIVCTMPFLCVALCGAIVGAAGQVGGLLVFSRIKPDAKHINPAEGLKKMLGVKNLVNAAKALVKAIVLGSIGYTYIATSLVIPVGTAYASPWNTLYIAGKWLTPLLAVAGGVYIAMAAVDYLYERYEFMKKQRMSTDELRRENKESEGDPQIKAKRTAIARDSILFGLRERMKYASAVLYGGNSALGLYYDGVNTPQVIAKGEGEAATRILEEARATLVPIKEDPHLTKIIMDAVMLDLPIARNHFKQVKELFAWAEGK